MKIIRKREISAPSDGRAVMIVDDDFVHVPDGVEIAPGIKPIVTLARYAKEGGQLVERYPAFGVRIASDKLPSDIVEPQRLALIAIEFPKFTDGRGYSVARMLRQRHGFAGELRAVGWVLRDQLHYMARCGFDAFELQPGKSLESALEAFAEFSVSYQTDAGEKRPLYRRR